MIRNTDIFAKFAVTFEHNQYPGLLVNLIKGILI